MAPPELEQKAHPFLRPDPSWRTPVVVLQVSGAQCWRRKVFVFMQPQGWAPCVAVLCKHKDCWRAGAGASSPGMQMAAPASRLHRGVRCECSWPFPAPGAVSWHPEHSRAMGLAPCWCRGSSRSTGRELLVQRPRRWGFSAGCTEPGRGKGWFYEGRRQLHRHGIHIPDLKPAFVHAISIGISGVWWHAEGVWAVNTGLL